MNTKTFRFNEHNVCLNPDKIIIGKHVMIKVAEYAGEWVSGHDYMFVNTGSGHPCSKRGEKHPNKMEAVKYEIKKVIRFIEDDINLHKDTVWYQTDIKRMKKSVKDLKQYLFDITHVQLSLF